MMTARRPAAIAAGRASVSVDEPVQSGLAR
jgi:hypothetical protein